VLTELLRVTLQKHSFQAELTYPAELIELAGSSNEEDRVYLFLHGYAENAEVFHKRVTRTFTPKCRSIFLNGSFPIPTIRGDVVLYQFAWYFYNALENKYYVDFNTPVESIKKILNKLNISESTKLTIIGYSQGGYLAPFLAKELPNADKVISINASIREDKLESELNFHLDQLHAIEDERVEFKLAKERFEKLSPRLPSSQWIEMPNETHQLSENILKTLEKTLT
jgi:predicted esterase